MLLPLLSTALTPPSLPQRLPARAQTRPAAHAPRWLQTLSLAAVGLALTACENLPSINAAPPAAPVIQEVKVPVEVRVEVPVPTVSPADAAGRQLLGWQDNLRVMSGDALTQEINRLSEGMNGTPPAAAPAQAVRLALALGQGRANGDLPRAIGLLEQVQRSSNPEAASWHGWARLLSVRFQEQRRLEDLVERQAQQLREGQRQRDQLNEKLDALRAIERSLTRPPSAGSK